MVPRTIIPVQSGSQCPVQTDRQWKCRSLCTRKNGGMSDTGRWGWVGWGWVGGAVTHFQKVAEGHASHALSLQLSSYSAGIV